MIITLWNKKIGFIINFKMLFSLLVGGVGLIVVYLFVYGLYYPVHRKIMLFLLIVGIWELLMFQGLKKVGQGLLKF